MAYLDFLVLENSFFVFNVTMLSRDMSYPIVKRLKKK